MNLEDVPRVKKITKREFIKHYFKPQKPVVIEQSIEEWPAYSKWNMEYIKKVAGDKIVPLYDDRPVRHEEGFNQPHAQMKMADYIELLKTEPTKYKYPNYKTTSPIPILVWN